LRIKYHHHIEGIGNHAKRQRLLTALQRGKDAVAAGRYTEYTPELLDRLFDEAMAEEENGEPLELDPDVIPQILS